MNGVTEVATWSAPSARVEPPRLAPGERGRIVVTIDVPGGCHVQSHTPREPFLIPTALELDDTSAVTFGSTVYPDGETKRLDWTPVVMEVYRDSVEIVVPVDVEPTAMPGTMTVSGRVRYQGCTDIACLPPAEHPLEVDLEVVGRPSVARDDQHAAWRADSG